MSQSLSNVLIHLVFSTKDRTAWLRKSETRDRLFAYLATVANNQGCPPVLVGGYEDHVHLLVNLSRTKTISDLVRGLKTSASSWIKTQFPALHSFQWQGGYGVFSVSESRRDDVCEYIRNQEEHHRQRTFQEEFREMCRRHCIELDEKYVWD